MRPSTSTSARLWISRTPGTAIAAAWARSRRPASSSGSTCTTTSLPGSARSSAASTASAAAWPWPTAATTGRRSRRRRTGARPPAASAAGAARPRGAARRSPRARPPRPRPARDPSARRRSRASAWRRRRGRAPRRRAPRSSRRRDGRPGRAAGRRAPRSSRRGRWRSGARSRRARRSRTAATPARRSPSGSTSIAITTATIAKTYQVGLRRLARRPEQPLERPEADEDARRARGTRASASAVRCSALPCPYWCVTSAGRPATPTAKNVSSAATRSVPEWIASETRPRLCVASPTVSFSATSERRGDDRDERGAALRAHSSSSAQTRTSCEAANSRCGGPSTATGAIVAVSISPVAACSRHGAWCSSAR